jgi:hypothetical protein
MGLPVMFGPNNARRPFKFGDRVSGTSGALAEKKQCDIVAMNHAPSKFVADWHKPRTPPKARFLTLESGPIIGQK